MATPLARVLLLQAPRRTCPASQIPRRRHLRPSVSFTTAAVPGGVSGPVLRMCKNCKKQFDPAARTYIFKLMNSSGITESGESEKVLLLMESGVRLHSTQYVRDKSSTPSGFTLKPRKHVRSKRLEDVRMLGYDRMVLFQFGLGSNAHFIILEFYAQGNIILTDSGVLCSSQFYGANICLVKGA
ncbi:uncharacterized protein [Lolium perenne]|uniref:uncharacterized protein n=1 Tax=Lolium perenne TaxID=4522 RepID=UPI0021F66809|nr:uncharacterized protein LOC127312359 [Lolium perenne]